MTSNEADEARAALYRAIQNVAETAADYGGETAGAMLRDAALAWRALTGGTQPGSIIIQK
jgi:hypothetical protein